MAGGGGVYTEAMQAGVADLLLVTVVERENRETIETDVSMQWPLPHDSTYELVMQGPAMSENGFLFRFTCWSRRAAPKDNLQLPKEPAEGFWYGTLR